MMMIDALYSSCIFTINNIIGFLKVPQSQVVALGERGVFDCQHCAANGVDWRLSGKRLTANTLPEGVMITYNLPKSLTCGAVHTLIIEDIVTYNRSTIQCEVYINDVPDERSEQALLLSQGNDNYNTRSTRAC